MDFFPTLRHLGQTGVVINVYLLDGALFRSLARKFKAKHLVYYKFGPDLGIDARRLKCSDWTVCILCPSHVMGNGLLLGLNIVSRNDIVKATHVANASLRSTYTAFFKQVPDVVFKCSTFVVARA